MKKLIVLLLSYNFSCAESTNNNIDDLKKSGYVEITCNDIERYKNNGFNYIEINRDLEYKRDFILARCFEDNSCFFDMNYNKQKITCQRYFISDNIDYKIKYLDNSHKEFLSHRVLYFTTKNN